MSWVKMAAEQIEKFTPKPGGGFNVVAVDAYEMPGEALYLVGNYKTEEEANKMARDHARKSGDKAYVYAAARE
jgi:hypothetical protein